MQQIQLADQLYRQAEQRARVAGFASVDEFIADLLQNDFDADSHNLDDRFTPEVNAYLSRVAADMEDGKGLSIQEVERHLDEARNAWRRNPTS